MKKNVIIPALGSPESLCPFVWLPPVVMGHAFEGEWLPPSLFQAFTSNKYVVVQLRSILWRLTFGSVTFSMFHFVFSDPDIFCL